MGSLVDLVEIDDGWEAAFEAAAGAGVATVVVDGRRSAQAALATLRERGVTGAVLAPRAAAGAAAAAVHDALPTGSSAEPVRGHVRARRGGAAAESVLDTLVGRAVRVDGWEEAIDLSLARDDLVVVTPEGDRFAATGWRVRSATGVVTAAAAEEARRKAGDAAAAAELARAHLTESRHRTRPRPGRARRSRAGRRPARVGLRDRPGRPGPRHRGAAAPGRRARRGPCRGERGAAGALRGGGRAGAAGPVPPRARRRARRRGGRWRSNGRR